MIWLEAELYDMRWSHFVSIGRNELLRLGLDWTRKFIQMKTLKTQKSESGKLKKTKENFVMKIS
ncbi:CLUMA_CG002177, isoform A [Clunio marinus]|uniref:CLUMA_CG002177, isoform A n=1 Tax=Clunio marinus TaxID=568069 RepID=A0A1J1HK17_9DIPT|nr:CLUMA_CG002177, isoform A [Clunio marinus]